MRTGRRRLATAVCIPLILLALSACGPEGEASSSDSAPSAEASSSPGKADEVEGGSGEAGAEEGGTAAEEPTEVSTDLPKDEIEPTGPPAENAADAQVLHYEIVDADEYADAIRAGADQWNQSLVNVELRPVEGDQQTDIQFVVGNGWPETSAPGATTGMTTVTMGRQAMDEGHNVYRVAAHEFGHALGLGDRRNKGCSSLMSGHKGGTDCQNTVPDAFEKRTADAKYAQ